MSLLALSGTNSAVAGGYDIANSCKFEDDNDEWLYRANVSGTNTKTWTVSWWFKQTELRSVMGTATNHWTGGAYGEATRAGVDEYDRLWIDVGGGDGNPGSRFRSLSTARLRDTAAWYHVVIACDSTQSTEADRLKVWLNGVEVTVWDQHQIPTLNFASGLAGFAGIQMKWGSTDATYSGYSGYLAECNYLDGVTATQNDFGEFDEDSGIWKPKAYTGSYGTNGTYLDFTNASDLGDDKSGNGNDYTLNNITSADQATDTPTNSFCTLNPLMANAGPANYLPITEGGIKAVNTAAAYKIANSTFGVTSGKWYWEVKATDVNGVTAIGVTMPNYWDADYTLQGCIYYAQGPQRYNNASASSFGSGYTDGDIISFALDMDATPPTMEVYKNNVSEGNLMAGLTINGTGAAFLPEKEDGYFPKVVGYNANTFECNFGGFTTFSISSAESDENGYGTFEYAPPSGYYALCTKNLAEYG